MMRYIGQNCRNLSSLPSDLKYNNRIQVMNVFSDGDSYSTNDVAEKIGLSRQTVKKSIQFFQDKGLLITDGKGLSTTAGGKRPELYTFTRTKYFLCITLWPKKLWMNLYTIGYRLVDALVSNVFFSEGPQEAMRDIGHLAEQFLLKNQIPLNDVCAVSLSISGIIDYKAGCLKYNSQMPSWGVNVPLKKYLQEYFAEDTLIFLENSGKMTARPFLLEPKFEDKRILTIFSGWGLSGCLIEKRHILCGRNSLIGEIGHMVLDPSDKEQCGCGRKGCFERLVSINRIRSMIADQKDRFPDSLLTKQPLENITIPGVFKASEKKDRLAQQIVRYLSRCFAMALCNICLVFDPDYIIFQGDYAFADDYFNSQLYRNLDEFQYFTSENMFSVLYDRRPLKKIDAQGSYIALVHQYFSNPELYRDSKKMMQ